MNEERIHERIEELRPKYPTLGLPLVDMLVWYAMEGRPTGGFMRAFLANDLMEAVGRADDQNKYALHIIAMFVYNEIPGGRTCHGSYEIYDAWIEKHQARREQEAKEESEG